MSRVIISGYYRVIRGGSWDYDADGSLMARRYGSSPDFRFNFDGFRIGGYYE